MDVFRVRLNCVDHYQTHSTPYDPQLQQNSQVPNELKVPIIRVFGSTETGQKVCAHIHGALPYLYIEYSGSLDPDKVEAYIHQLHLSIDHALGVSYRRNVYDGKNNYVAKITLVKGIPFYGYHVGYHFYLKIYMLNPIYTHRLSVLLLQGMVMKKIFQPYEAHLQYLLQWMVDYNLYGCGYIDCRKAYFRSPVPRYEDLENDSHLWHDHSIPPEYILGEGILPRLSHCSIEVDICVQDILNRMEINARPLHHDFIERLHPSAPGEKLVPSMAGLWRDETRRRKSRMADPDPGSNPFPPEVMMSMSADPRDLQGGGWIHEEDYMERIRELISEEKDQHEENKPSFETFIKKSKYEGAIKTVYESVDDLYPENLGRSLGLNSDKSNKGDKEDAKFEESEVDDRIININDDNFDFPYDSDEDIFAEPREKEDDVEEMQQKPPVSGVFDGSDGSESPLTAQQFHNQVIDRTDHSTASGISCGSTPPERGGKVADTSYTQTSPDNPLSKVPDQSKGSGNLDQTLPPLGIGVKRTRLESSQNDGYNKRQRIEPRNHISKLEISMRLGVDSMISKSQNTFSETEVGNIYEPSRSGKSTPTTLPKKSSLESLDPKGRPNQKLPFTVVKDPHEPSTILRLSQGYSSQKSIGSSQGKGLSFKSPSKLLPDEHVLQSSQNSSLTSNVSCRSEVVSTVLENVALFFPRARASKLVPVAGTPPTAMEVNSSMQEFNLLPVVYQEPYYSNELDVPERAREWAGREFKLESLSIPFLPDFDAKGLSAATFGEKPGVLFDKVKEERISENRRRVCGLRSWEIGDPPPTYNEVKDWVDDEVSREHDVAVKIRAPNFPNKSHDSPVRRSTLSQIEGPTQMRHEFKYSQNKTTTSVKHEAQYMSIMSLEIHVNTRGNFVPNPEEDEVQCIFWSFESDEVDFNHKGVADSIRVGIVVLSEDGTMARNIIRQVKAEVIEETSELDLLLRMVELVRTYDPDILTGYEVHGGSWGYLIERARLKYDYDLCDGFSRMKSQSHGRFDKDNKWGFNNTSSIRVTGRHMINIWRAMCTELSLLQYTMENVVFHQLHRRIPHYSWKDLTLWYSSGKLKDLAKILDYYVSRVQLDLEILEQNELISRTSEQARLLGVDFFSVISRGSQFKVESLMFRIAKPENFLLVSPSRKQVGSQNALECLPLVMEPQSAFYSSPLLVLDFRSLYPSVMIAYNYCYSTFLGRVTNWRGTNKMGFTDYKRQHRLLELLQDHINIAPNGMMYVKPEIRKSLLAKMLGEILETRVMVKSSMKEDKEDRTLQLLLNNRQLALKLIANVTYGYTSASFSGRMPCSEIADSIVQTARETLEKAIALIHSVKRWDAEVVYGDTDSLFVYLKGRTRDQAFDIGNEIAKTITNMNPRPVKLKFEKVYHPSVLLAKKRYVGFKYENKDQKEPEFDAKGIETVRRDGTPAEQKIEETALKILFRSKDLSEVKSYFQKQCEKIMRGSVSIQDFCFAKEVRLGTYSENGIPPPGALISTRRMLEDTRAEPQYGERVPYVVVTGAPGARLIDRCVAPDALLNSDHYELDAEYYISKNIIPPLDRIFNLLGANVRNWYDQMPKVQRIRRIDVNLQRQGPSRDLQISKKTLESYMKSSSCLVCREKIESEGPICTKCLANRPLSLLTIRTRLTNAQKKCQDLERICQSCSGLPWSEEVKCDSKDCPVFYTRVKQRAKLRTENSMIEPVVEALQGTRDGLGELDW